jgi:hypothetical protein
MMQFPFEIRPQLGIEAWTESTVEFDEAPTYRRHEHAVKAVFRPALGQ